MEKIFKRKAYEKMLKWKAESNGKSALLIEGARRVGKSTLARQFAVNEYKSYILIDCSKLSADVRNLLDLGFADLNYFFMRLQILYRVNLYERRSVIIFDEVQLRPDARQAIKHLVEDGRYDYIETGSLISIKQNVQNIVIPSEEERIQMFPMDYEEFSWAVGDTATMPILKDLFLSRTALGEAVNRKIMRDFRLYMLVGGMPQAVETYLETNNLQAVDAAKRRIINLYIEDLHKLDSTGKLRAMFRAIPSELGKTEKHYQVTTVVENIRKEKTFELLETLYESMIVNIAYHSSDPNAGLALSRETTRFKMFMGDTGLFVTLAFWDKDFTENIIYHKLLSDKLEANLGYIYENVVAQMLRASGYELYYYTFPASGNHSYEIDFLLSKGNKLVPVEVKSSGYKTHKSLDAFCEKFSSRISERIMLYTKDLQKDGQTICLPVYMTPFL